MDMQSNVVSRLIEISEEIISFIKHKKIESSDVDDENDCHVELLLTLVVCHTKSLGMIHSNDNKFRENIITLINDLFRRLVEIDNKNPRIFHTKLAFSIDCIDVIGNDEILEFVNSFNTSKFCVRDILKACKLLASIQGATIFEKSSEILLKSAENQANITLILLVKLKRLIHDLKIDDCLQIMPLIFQNSSECDSPILKSEMRDIFSNSFRNGYDSFKNSSYAESFKWFNLCMKLHGQTELCQKKDHDIILENMILCKLCDEKYQEAKLLLEKYITDRCNDHFSDKLRYYDVLIDIKLNFRSSSVEDEQSVYFIGKLEKLCKQIFDGIDTNDHKIIEIIINELYEADDKKLLYMMLDKYVENISNKSINSSFIKLHVKLSYDMKFFDKIIIIFDRILSEEINVSQDEKETTISFIIQYLWKVSMIDYKEKSKERIRFLKKVTRYAKGDLSIESYKELFMQLYSNLDFQATEDALLFNEILLQFRSFYKDSSEVTTKMDEEEKIAFQLLLDLSNIKSCLIMKDPSIYSQTHHLICESKKKANFDILFEIASMQWDLKITEACSLIDQCLEIIYHHADNRLKWKSLILATKIAIKHCKSLKKTREQNINRLESLIFRVEDYFLKTLDETKICQEFYNFIGGSLEWLIINVWNISLEIANDADMSMMDVKSLFESCIKLANNLPDQQDSLKSKIHTAYGYILEKIDFCDNFN